MEIKDWSSAKDTPALYRELKELDLLENLAELEAFGYTVLSPEKVGSVETVDSDHLEIRVARNSANTRDL